MAPAKEHGRASQVTMPLNELTFPGPALRRAGRFQFFMEACKSNFGGVLQSPLCEVWKCVFRGCLAGYSENRLPSPFARYTSVKVIGLRSRAGSVSESTR